jgi:hypothetical protein
VVRQNSIQFNPGEWRLFLAGLIETAPMPLAWLGAVEVRAAVLLTKKLRLQQKHLIARGEDRSSAIRLIIAGTGVIISRLE